MRCKRTDLVATEDVEEILVVAASQSVILITAVVLLEVSVEPLAELEVVEGSSLHQFRGVDMPLDTILVEGELEDLVIFDIFVLSFGVPLNALEWESARVHRIKHGAVDGARSALLNLRQLKLKVTVEPFKDLRFAHEVGFVHHADRL